MSGVHETRLVRTCVGADPHTLVLRRTDDGLGLDTLFDLVPDDPTDAVAVTHRRPERLVREWSARTDRSRNVGVVSVGEQMRSSTAASPPTAAARTTVRGVPDPTDTADLRDAVTGYLDAWPAGGEQVVYLDSLTALLGRVDVEGVTEFLRELLRALDARGAVGYVRLTPAAHERRVVREVTSLFDTVAETVAVSADAADRPPVDACVEAVADPRRRAALAAVADGEPASVSELADRVAARRPVDRERAATSLRQVHLPRLAELGALAHDRERDRVAPGEQFDAVEPYLRAATDAPDRS